MTDDEFDAAPAAAEVALLDEELERFNAKATGKDDFQPLNYVIRDTAGQVIAGIKAQTGWEWLYVQVLWVKDNHRRSGNGSKLLKQAEREAVRRGCIGACLSSYDFQAPDFYRRHGYEVFGQIDDYPSGHTMYFFSKRLR